MTAAAVEALAQCPPALPYEALAARVAERTKDCPPHTSAAATFGARSPRSKMVADYARRFNDGGRWTVIVMQLKYSVPFCVAVALYRDSEDPKSFAGGALEDPAIRATCGQIESSVCLEPGQGKPADPLTRTVLKRKFILLCADMEAVAAEDVFARWAASETQASVRISVA
jgi:hypothetical protein